MSNPDGVTFESKILDAEQEKAIKQFTAAAMKQVAPALADMKNDPVVPITSAKVFTEAWDPVFPGIGQEIMVTKESEESPHWGSLTSLTQLIGAVDAVNDKFEGKEDTMPKYMKEALANLRAVLVTEANEVGNGMQRYIDEVDEPNDKRDLVLIKREVTDKEIIKTYRDQISGKEIVRKFER